MKIDQPTVFIPRKRFAHWIFVKRDIDDAQHTPPFYKEGEIWWCFAGENVGMEINGKGEQFTRPFLVFKKYDARSFLGLPVTTSVKNGVKYAHINVEQSVQTVNLSQGRTFDYRRLKEKHGELSVSDFRDVESRYASLHLMIPINRPPAITGGSRGQSPEHGLIIAM